MKKRIEYILFAVIFAFTFISCDEDVLKSDYDYVPDPSKLPSVSLTLGTITGASVQCAGSITFVGQDTAIIEKGFVCAQNVEFTLGVVTAKNESAEYVSEVAGLQELKEYFVKAYVITKNGVAFSDVLTFSTPLLKNPLLFLCGNYYETDYKLADNTVDGVYEVKLSEIEGNVTQLKLSNFWGGGEDVLVTVDTTAKTISLAPQTIYVDETYGNAKPYPIKNGAVDKSGAPVIGTYNAAGEITFGNWSASVDAGSFGKYSKSTLIPVANDMAGVYTEVDYKADGSVEATYTDKIIISPVPGELSRIKITNYWDGGNKEIYADVNFDEGTLSILPQVIYVDATYGNCQIFPYNVEANTVDKTGTATTGTIGEDGVITINSWAAIVDAGAFGKYQKSTLTKSASSGMRKKVKLISNNASGFDKFSMKNFIGK
jgi:hypothetical protein